jgi:peptide/nickel transport system substrate-binding protein
MSKPISTLLLIALIVALLSACAPAPIVAPPEKTNEAAPAATKAEKPSEAAETRGVLRVPHFLVFGGAENLDPAHPKDFGYASRLLYDRLVNLDDNGMPVPALATKWAANADATQWTFTLREGVTFHDGSAFDSADVAYTFAHILDPATQSPAATPLALLASTETPDPQTVVFKLKQAHADFPMLLSGRPTGIIPTGSAAAIAASGIGTGPFKLKSLDVTGTTVFVANDNYWRGKPGLAGVEMPAIKESGARIQALQAGQIDLLVPATATDADMVKGNDQFAVLSYPSGTWFGLVMRVDKPPFDDLRVRQAIRLVVDRQAMVSLVLNGAGKVSCDTAIGLNKSYRWEPSGGCPQDVKAAKALLASAGYANGLDLTLYTSNVLPFMIPLAEVFQKQAAAAGINVKLNLVPADSFFSKVWLVEPFMTTSWLDRPTDEMLNLNWRSDAKWNESHFQDSAFDALLNNARKALDLKERTRLYQEAQQTIAEKGGHVIPFHINEFAIMSKAVSGFPARPIEQVEWYAIKKNK